MTDELKKFDEFIIESLIGKGGMGTVYRARQVALDRWVALKILSSARENPAFTERFYREARSAAKLVHPNIIQIYTVGEHQGIPYFTMEYIEGADLQQLLAAGMDPMTASEIVEIIRGVSKALGRAAEQGIVHRDIKPANIMITRSGLVKVMDFGLAKGLAALDESHTPNAVIGTPAYMSPEQGNARPIDTRSDLYSLGCVLYECLCGRQPFAAENMAALIYKQTYEKPEPPGNVRPGIDAALERVCLKLMAKDPAQRYQTAAEVLAALSQVPVDVALVEDALGKRVETAQHAKKNRDMQRKGSITPVVTRPKGMAIPSAASVAALSSAPGTRASARSLPVATAATPPAADAGPRPAGGPGPAKDEPAVRDAAALISAGLQKLADGRWSYHWDKGPCALAEGLALTARLPNGQKPRQLGDCVLCSNFSVRLGCVLGRNGELQASAKTQGLRALVEQAEGWLETPNCSKAIALLDGYVKRNPEEAGGYRELARLYERPEYKGSDKRRAIVLYRRFAELARAGGFASVEVLRAEEQARKLSQSLPAGGRTSTRILLGPALSFQCFYRNGSVCYAHVVANTQQLLVAYAGGLDPESGKLAADLGGPMVRATTMFRRFKSDEARKEEQARVGKELERLVELPPEALLTDSACVLKLHYEDVRDLHAEQRSSLSFLSIKTDKQTHQLIFSAAGTFKMEQCLELLRRRSNLA